MLGNPLGTSILGGGSSYPAIPVDTGGLGVGTSAGMRTLSSEIEQAIDELNQRGCWAHLFDVTINSTTTQFLTDYPENVTYNSIPYSAAAIAVDNIPFTAKPEIQTFNVQVANIDRIIATYLEEGAILGNDLLITWVFIREIDNTVVRAFSEKYQILSAEIDNDKAAAVFQVGKYNLYKVRFPRNRWIDFRCGFIFREENTCSYGREDFEGTSDINLKSGGDGLKIQGWTAMNVAQAGVLFADINQTAASKLTFTIANNFGLAWDLNTNRRNGPFLYQLFQPESTAFSGDFDIETLVGGNEDENGEGCGVMICTNSDLTSDWLFFRRSIGLPVTVPRLRLWNVDNGVMNTSYNQAGSEKYLRIVKVGTQFTFYKKALAADNWIQLVQVTRADLNGVTLRIGLVAESFLNTRINNYTAQFDYFRMNSGGFRSCKRTIEECRARSNIRRFGGSPGTLHGAILL